MSDREDRHLRLEQDLRATRVSLDETLARAERAEARVRELECEREWRDGFSRADLFAA